VEVPVPNVVLSTAPSLFEVPLELGDRAVGVVGPGGEEVRVGVDRGDVVVTTPAATGGARNAHLDTPALNT
jgi:hypothetical protein